MNKIFRKKEALKHIVKKAFVATDIENNPHTGTFICGHFFGQKKDHHGVFHSVEHYSDSLKDYLSFARALNKKECTLVFFNLSYDYPFLRTITNDDKLLVVGSRFIAGEVKDGVKMLDISNHASDGSLEYYIEQFKMSEKYGLKKETLDDLKVRVVSDTKATFYLAEEIQEFYNSVLKMPIKLTLASQARGYYLQHFFKHYWSRDNDTLDAMERESYRGGRTEVFRYDKQNVYSYDVNSMYLSIMRDEVFPDPNSGKITNSPIRLPDKGLYIAKCNVTVPPQYIPPLPFHKEKLLFPVGTFTGVFCSPELEYAIKECGVKVNSIEWVITYKGHPYFKEFAQSVWDSRKKFKKLGNRAFDLLIKKIGNSFYGGLGQRNTDINFIGKTENYNGDIPEGSRPVFSEVAGVEYMSLTAGDKTDSSHTFVCIPSFVTSYARLKLLKMMKKYQKHLVYVDTDCVRLNIKLNLDDKELGLWGFEKDRSGESIYYRPKMCIINGEKIIKGVKKKAHLTDDNDKEMVWVFQKPHRLRESIRRNLIVNQWEWVEKVLEKKDDKRLCLSGGYSLPLQI